MTTLVTGARGAVGRRVLRGLLDAGVSPADLRASGRDPHQRTVPDGVAAVAADFTDRGSLQAALTGISQVFLLTPRGDPSPIADALRAAGVRHAVLLSSAAVDLPRGGVLTTWHRALEDAVAASGASVTALRPNAFADNTLSWAREISTTQTVSLPYPDSRTAPIHSDDIADAAIAALTGRAERGTPVRLTGPQSLSFRDQAAILAGELGHGIEVIKLAPSQARERFVTAGVPADVVDALLDLWAAGDGVPAPVHDVERLTGRPGRTFAQWARENRAVFTGAA